MQQHYPRAKAAGFLKAWAKEDVYFTLEQERDLLQRAGFTVADYTGGSGGSIRLAGVNGVGYSHELEHYAALYVIYHFDRGITIKTEGGWAFVYPQGATQEEVKCGVENAGI